MTQELLVDSAADWQALLDGVVADFAGLDWRPWATREFAALQGFHDKLFQSETDPAGKAWPALAPSTVARKKHSVILWEYSNLRRSLTGLSAEGVADVEGQWPDLRLVFGTNVPYSKYHSRRDGHARRLPAREHVGVDARFISAATERAADHALKELTK